MTERPKRDSATVEQRDGGHVVIVAGEVLAGPFQSEALAWRWIDRSEVHEVWQRDAHRHSKWSRGRRP